MVNKPTQTKISAGLRAKLQRRESIELNPRARFLPFPAWFHVFQKCRNIPHHQEVYCKIVVRDFFFLASFVFNLESLIPK
mmetsp:Transcript_21173/g.44950  ORF Transcript_21173/g.44950 Transcript_21173/m.44950 type:complete len:80 (+) Transcript_21173:77-316(+)